MEVYLAVFALSVGAVLSVLYAVRTGSQAEKVQGSLDRLQAYDTRTFRETELAAPASERLWAPVVGRFAALARLITPGGRLGRLQRRVEQAGRPYDLDLNALLALKIVAMLLVVVMLGLGGAGIVPGRLAVWLTLVGAAVAYYVPDMVVASWVRERKRRISRALPDFLDLLTVTVEAGLGFESALARIASRIRPPLGEELLITLHHMRVGQSREVALRAFADRCGVGALDMFVSALIQASKLGTPLGKILRTQADVMRVTRRQSIELAAQKAPLKMLFPLMICIFPVLFVVILGPAAIRIYEAFSAM